MKSFCLFFLSCDVIIINTLTRICRLFLIGLNKYGKGDWRSISRNVVVTRTPTQVASHAQKYYLRQTAVKKERKRSSIHDITTADNSVTVPPPVNLPNQGGFQDFSFPMPRWRIKNLDNPHTLQLPEICSLTCKVNIFFKLTVS